ncbi:MAG: lysine--tRNA ligase, partial [Acidobacteria bacterium]|nr:lysine--tRNA ligase [Acidobacteriota bacterium]
YAGVEIEKLRDAKFAFAFLQENGVKMEKKPGFGGFCDETLKKLVEPKIKNPTFIYNYPIELSPLAKLIPGETMWVERFQPVIAGYEVGNAFSELNDPQDQLNRFEGQEKARSSGDEEAHQTDTDFVETLAVGMPPTGGLGIGIDRIVMLLTDQVSIREVLAFPQLRRQSGDIS